MTRRPQPRRALLLPEDSLVDRRPQEPSRSVPASRYFDQLVQEYQDRCEAYDRSVCTWQLHGVAMPRNGDERYLVNRNAVRIRDELLRRACHELPADMIRATGQFTEAMRAWCRRQPKYVAWGKLRSAVPADRF